MLGIGLIGGSIGLAARRPIAGRPADIEVCGYDPNETTRAIALELGAIDTQASDIPSAVAGADVVFVAAPVSALTSTVRAALEEAPPDCVVSDVGSTKRIVADAGADERFIGGHPLAGAETAGVEHAREDLFDGATWYLTPARGNTAGVFYERLHQLLRSFGAHPTPIDADTHDRLMASVSHLPHVFANLLVAQASSLLAPAGSSTGPSPTSPAQSSESQRLSAVGPSFRDATRVAGANSDIWTDIYISNRDALSDALDEAIAGLGEVRRLLKEADADALAAWNERARCAREELLG